MKKDLHISDVADLFGVPVSTLRYWEKEGLVKFERSDENNYRSASMVTIRNLCDITFYRTLSVPIEKLRSLLQMNYNDIEQVLLQNKESLYIEIEKLHHTIENIDAKLDQIETLKRLKEVPTEFVTESMKAVRAFDLLESSDLRNLVNFERKLIVMIPPYQPKSYHYGAFVEDDYPPEKLVRKKDGEPKLYFKILMQTSYDKIEENNLNYYYDYLENMGYEPGLAMGKVLVSGYEDKLYNYYETWIEVTKRRG